MKVNSGVAFGILIGITMLLMAGMVFGIYTYTRLEPQLADQALRSELVRLQSAARVYYSRIQTYEGVCKDISVPADYACNANVTEFAISVERDDGSFYCTDATGHLDSQLLAIRNYTSCNP